MFNPLKVSLNISTSATGAPHTALEAADMSPEKLLHTPPQQDEATTTGRQEVKLLLPEIDVVADSKDFAIFVDIITNIATPQVLHACWPSRNGHWRMMYVTLHVVMSKLPCCWLT